MRGKAWGLLGVQVVLICAVMFLPSGNTWVLPDGVSRAVQGISWIGLAIVVAGLIGLGAAASPLPTPTAGGSLKVGGLFRFVRHPIYSGLFLWASASAALSGSPAILACAIGLMGWVAFKARWEEGRLMERYPDYAAYAARTPRYVPFWPTRPSTPD